MDTQSQLSEDQVLNAIAVVATPVGAAALLSEWLERTVTAAEVSQCIARSERLRRVTAFCRSVQTPDGPTDAEARIRAMAGPLRWRDRRARK
ncbi:MAG: hypothetical protein ACREUF_06875 [Solimonas sp.]